MLQRNQLKFVFGGYDGDGSSGGGYADCTIYCKKGDEVISTISVSKCPDSNPIDDCPSGTTTVSCGGGSSCLP